MEREKNACGAEAASTTLEQKKNQEKKETHYFGSLLPSAEWVEPKSGASDLGYPDKKSGKINLICPSSLESNLGLKSKAAVSISEAPLGLGDQECSKCRLRRRPSASPPIFDPRYDIRVANQNSTRESV